MKPEFAGESEYTVLGMDRMDFEARYAAGYDLWGTGKIRDPYEMMRQVLQGLDIPAAVMGRAVEARMERIRKALYGIDDKKLVLLKSLREGGYKTALISNADIADIYYWQGAPLGRCFDEVIFSYHEGLLKPDPRIYRLAAERLQVLPELCCYVGDGGHGELGGARAVGMTTVLTTEYIRHIWPEKIPALGENADYTVESLDAIATLILDGNAQ